MLTYVSYRRIPGTYAGYVPLRGRGILGSGWQMQTCAVESPLLVLECAGVLLLSSISLSSTSTVLAVRFLVVVFTVPGGLSSGVIGAIDPIKGVDGGFCERDEVADDDDRLSTRGLW